MKLSHIILAGVGFGMFSAAAAFAEMTHEQELCEQEGQCGPAVVFVDGVKPVYVPVPTDGPGTQANSAAIAANKAAIAELRGGLSDANTRANLALAMSTLQMDFTQENYIGGGLAFYDGSTAGVIGYNRRLNNRASIGAMLATDGSEWAVGINAGFGW